MKPTQHRSCAVGIGALPLLLLVPGAGRARNVLRDLSQEDSGLRCSSSNSRLWCGTRCYCRQGNTRRYRTKEMLQTRPRSQGGQWSHSSTHQHHRRMAWAIVDTKMVASPDPGQPNRNSSYRNSGSLRLPTRHNTKVLSSWVWLVGKIAHNAWLLQRFLRWSSCWIWMANHRQLLFLAHQTKKVRFPFSFSLCLHPSHRRPSCSSTWTWVVGSEDLQTEDTFSGTALVHVYLACGSSML